MLKNMSERRAAGKKTPEKKESKVERFYMNHS